MAHAILAKCAKPSHLLPKVVALLNSLLSMDSAVSNGKTAQNTKVNGLMARRTGKEPFITSTVTFTKESFWTIEPTDMAFTITKTALSMWAPG